MQSDRHADRVVAVTGAASGIGRGIARRFAGEGARVVVADVRHEPKQGIHYDTDVTTPTDERIREDGGEATYVETDVSDPDDCEALVDAAVDSYGRLDVLVNNAGIHVPGDSQELTIEEWRRVLGVDLDGAFYCAKFAVPHLESAEGDLRWIGSRDPGWERPGLRQRQSRYRQSHS